MDWFPLLNSIRISLIATVITFFSGICIAYYVAKLPRLLKGLCDTVLTIPLVLPPTVIGFLILTLISPKSVLGLWLNETFNLVITMKWYASVIAVFVVSFPLMYRTARSSFESFDKNLLFAGKTLGRSNTYVFWRILLPNCKSGIVAGLVLSFARGLGEYGATSMVSGYIANKTATISTTVAHYWQTNQDGKAMIWVLINIAISLVVMFTVNIFEKYIKSNTLKSKEAL